MTTRRTHHPHRRRRRIVPAVAPLMLLTLLLLASTTPTLAQTVTEPPFVAEVDLEEVAEPVVPVTGNAVVPGTVTITCARPHHSTETSTLQLEAKMGSPHAVATLVPNTSAIEIDPVRCAAGETAATIPINVSVVFTADAPVRSQVPLDVTVAGADLQEEATGQTLLTVAFLPVAQARLDLTIVKAPPGAQVGLPLTIENHANGPLKIAVRTGEDSSTGLTYTDMPVVETAAPDETRTTHLQVFILTPGGTGYVNERHTLVLDVAMWDAGDESNTLRPVTLNAVIQVQGSSVLGEAPALPVAPFLLVGLAALALARRPGS